MKKVQKILAGIGVALLIVISASLFLYSVSLLFNKYTNNATLTYLGIMMFFVGLFLTGIYSISRIDKSCEIKISRIIGIFTLLLAICSIIDVIIQKNANILLDNGLSRNLLGYIIPLFVLGTVLLLNKFIPNIICAISYLIIVVLVLIILYLISSILLVFTILSIIGLIPFVFVYKFKKDNKEE